MKNILIKSRADYIQWLIDEICESVPWATKEKFDINNNQWLYLVAHRILDDVDEIIARELII